MDLLYGYTASDAERDDVLIQFGPVATLEVGYGVSVLLTLAACSAAVVWTRGGYWQGEDARWRDVLAVSRRCSGRAQEGPDAAHLGGAGSASDGGRSGRRACFSKYTPRV